jgi:UDP-glucose 4,6-dehydratase
MNILITGGCGFIGSNFINYIIDKYPDYNFVNVDAMYYCASHTNIKENIKNAENYKFIEGNINDISLIKHILKNEHITHIIHFAAQSHVDTSFENSLQYTFDNVNGTHILLESVRQVNKDIIFLHFSTDEVYGESKDTTPKHEMSILCPTNPYSASKAAAEMYVNAYNYSYGIKTIITRGNNVYGPNQYPEKLIPKFINLLKQGKKCTIHGDGSSLRSFIHVYDVCTAVDLILHKGVIGEIYNIGSESENELSVLEITKILIKGIHNSQDNFDKYLEFIQDRPFNDKRYFISNDKIKALGWKQVINIYNGINNLITDCPIH